MKTTRRNVINMAGSALAVTALPAAAGPALATAATDPMFAAIEVNRTAVRTLETRPDELLPDKEFDRLSGIGHETWDQILQTNPTTVAGLLAFMAYAREDGHKHAFVNINEKEGTLEAWEAVERMIRAVAMATAPAAALAATGAPTDDPVIELIKAHDSAGRAYETFSHPDDEINEKMTREMSNELDELTQDLANCRPTTVAGCAALLAYVNQDPYRERWPDLDWHHWWRRLHVNVAAALARIVRSA